MTRFIKNRFNLFSHSAGPANNAIFYLHYFIISISFRITFAEFSVIGFKGNLSVFLHNPRWLHTNLTGIGLVSIKRRFINLKYFLFNSLALSYSPLSIA